MIRQPLRASVVILLGVILVTALMYLLGMSVFAIVVDTIPPWAL